MLWVAMGVMLGITGLVVAVHVVTGQCHHEPPDPWRPPPDVPHIPAQADGTEPATDPGGARSSLSAEEPFDR